LGHPDYLHLAECPTGGIDIWGNPLVHPTTLAPNAEALRFLEALYDQLLPHFRSDWFNVGCDETFELGQGRSRADCEKRGVGEVYLDFFKDLYGAVSRRGKRMLYWADMVLEHPDLLPRLPKDALALVWGYEAEHPFADQCRQLAEAGLSFGVSPGTAVWNTFGGRWDNARDNLAAAAEAGSQYGAECYLITEWGDNGHWQQHPIGWPAAVYGAGMAWSRRASRGVDIAEALTRHVLRDPTGRTAGGLIELQTVYLESGVELHNATILRAIFHDKQNNAYVRAVQQADPDRLSGLKAPIRRAESLLAEAELQNADGDLLLAELRFSAQMMRLAADLAEARCRTPDREFSCIPARQRANLAAQLRPLVQEFGRLWSQRSRPGDLDRSLRDYQAVLALLEHG
jgi:hypothetical protein